MKGQKIIEPFYNIDIFFNRKVPWSNMEFNVIEPRVHRRQMTLPRLIHSNRW